MVAYLSKQKSPHPYSSVSFSPCRQYAATACKDTLQIVRVGATGLRLVKTVITAPYFQQNDTTTTPTSRSSSTSRMVVGQQQQRQHDEGRLNLQAFALSGITAGLGGGGGGASAQQPAQPPAASSMMNVVITDVAWSSGKSSRKNKTKNESDDDEDDEGWQKIDKNSRNDGESVKQRLRSSMIAAAGSNGVIVVWNAETLLGIVDSPSSTADSGSNGPPSPAQAPEAVLCQHVRQVNRLAWHPSKHGLLLSASQDGTVLLWERRKMEDVSPAAHINPNANSSRFKGFFGGLANSAASSVQQHRRSQKFQWHCRATFQPKSEAVRDIRWSPFYEDGTCGAWSTALL